ncbi:MAG: hypothetical protein IBJ00_07740, partial [Alphaproteobacteria bacterium]|nr:hypothetical protein [Alphaproteobacteria bacterium]
LLRIGTADIAFSSKPADDESEKPRINLLRTAARDNKAPAVGSSSKPLPCNPKKLTHDQLKKIFLPRKSDMAVLDTQSGGKVARAKLKIKTDEGKSTDIIYVAPKTAYEFELKDLLSGETPPKLYGKFRDYLIKDRYETQTLANVEIDQACIAGYVIHYKKDDSPVLDDKIVYIAFTKTKQLYDLIREDPALGSLSVVERVRETTENNEKKEEIKQEKGKEKGKRSPRKRTSSKKGTLKDN